MSPGESACLMATFDSSLSRSVLFHLLLPCLPGSGPCQYYRYNQVNRERQEGLEAGLSKQLFSEEICHAQLDFVTALGSDFTRFRFGFLASYEK